MGGLYRIVHEEPPRLEHAGWLAPVLEHTMTRDPAARWSMTQVRDFLDQGRDVTIHPAPAATVDADGTRVLPPTRSEPVGVPPIVADPALVATPATAEAPRRRRRPVWPWVAAVVLLIAVAVLGWAALTSGNGGAGNDQAGGGTSSSPSSPKTSASSGTTDQAAAMEDFISTYLATVTQDDHATYAMLTPAFQQESGRFGGYHGFWKNVESATPSNIQADPASMTVSYDVDYVKTDGSTSSDHVTLQLEKNGSSFLIAGEA